ncbi:YciI family protein [Streptomyces sp. NBC_00344]|uniref:YciI family protein n=1 Tax=Streptomyces sp. NBC_00344 TaxID=2975720 RepID=UPI002E1FBF5C
MPRFVSLIRVDENQPEGEPSPELMARMDVLIKEMTEAGAMLDTGGLAPMADSRRVRGNGGTVTVLDGPFAEAKEVVGGYMLIQAADLAEAVEWTRRFVEIHEDEWDISCEVRQIFGPSDAG